MATSGGTTVRRGSGEGSMGMRERASAGLIFPGLYCMSKSNCASSEAHLCSNVPNFAERKQVSGLLSVMTLNFRPNR